MFIRMNPIYLYLIFILGISESSKIWKNNALKIRLELNTNTSHHHIEAARLPTRERKLIRLNLEQKHLKKAIQDVADEENYTVLV